MLIYNSMILWVAIVWIFYNLFYKNAVSNGMRTYSRHSETQVVPTFIAVLTFAYFIFWAGIRSGVADTAEYIRMFEGTSTSLFEIPKILLSDSKAPGFECINILFKCFISDNYHVWLMAIALCSGIPVMLTLKKHSIDFMYSAFLFIVTLNFFWMFNGIRQFIVVAIAFSLSDWIEEGKTVQYIAVVLLLSTIHFTALILIPAYWIAQEKIFGPRIVLFILVLGIAIVNLEPVISAMELLLEETAYSGYSEQFVYDDGVNPVRVMAMAVTPAIAFVTRKQLRYMDNKYINICVNMSVVSAGLYLFGMFTSGILIGRLPIYFEIYNLVLLPYLLKKCFTKSSAIIMYSLCTVGFSIYYYLHMVNSYYISDITGLIGT